MTEIALLAQEAPDGVEWSPTHLKVLDVSLPFERFEQLVGFAGALGDAGRWILGDLLNFGDGRYGERYAQALELARVGERSLRRYQLVAYRIRSGRRRPALSFSHHEVVATLVPEDVEKQAYWLERAEAERATTVVLDALIRDALALAARPPRQASPGRQEVLGPVETVDAARGLSRAREALAKVGSGLEPDTAEALGIPDAIRGLDEVGDTVRRAAARLDGPTIRDLGRRLVGEATRSSGFAMVPLPVFEEFAAAIAAA